MDQKSPGRLTKTDYRASSIDQQRALRMGIANRFPGDTDAAGPGTSL